MDWLISSEANPRYEVRISGVDEHHAQTVLNDLVSSNQHPPGLVLTEVKPEKNGFLSRFFGG